MNKEDKIIALVKIVIPLMEILEKNGIMLCFEAYANFVSFIIYGENNFCIRWNCFDTEDHDWDAGETHFRTFESMKEILWTIREALS